MKKQFIKPVVQSIVLCFILLIAFVAKAQSDKDKGLIADCDNAKKEFLHTDALLKKLFDGAYGYAIFPNVGKGAVGVGGASGKGIVYEHGKIVGKAKMTQVTIGFQFGGQAYMELLFFENKESLDHFMADKVEFSAQASAVAITEGGSANAKYTNGIMIFTHQKGGLMYEASVGGQKFDYSAFEK
ncbi:YSC84-related protein [Solitalea sp. MAHUQ-68]|uniref:YSC84-related protein n=1 Tax=Solitalea agri TaxID=2953739 RepID=A0A9X2F5F3_9SPHI|nr:YSC84-related protein [Solitalea agri]MCO4294570.1 YSC84-related protein [Solitalea agri]